MVRASLSHRLRCACCRGVGNSGTRRQRVTRDASACCFASSCCFRACLASSLAAAAYSFARSAFCSRVSGTVVSSLSVRPTREDVDNGHAVLSECLLLSAKVRRVVQNDDVCARLREHPLEDCLVVERVSRREGTLAS